ncbi:alkaline phosphatase family protein [Verrucomicrobiales bacterium]|nr:alkaline phosphatase family protein [Verrucomicrobiales bacterium]
MLRILCLSLIVSTAAAEIPSVIAFGSCAKQTRKQPAWERMLEQKPDLFVFTGDCVYADTHDPKALRGAFNKLDAIVGFQKVRKQAQLLATWDDHDYGLNDEGEENPAKEAAQGVFLDFLKVAEDSPRRERDGIYHVETFSEGDKTLQVIVLDTRYFRSALKSAGKTHRYVPDADPEKTILGEAQWKWLEETLQKPADVRIITSSIQVIPEKHPFEKWANLPLEKQRLFDLIKSTKANGVILISGDRHMSEISEDTKAIGYPLIEVTSSGLTQAGGGTKEENEHRVGSIYRKRNYGVITIDWAAEDPLIGLGIRDAVNGEMMVEHSVKLSELK